MDKAKPLLFLSPKEWRAWLESHHANEKEAWVVIAKKGRLNAGLEYAQALEEALCYGWIDSRMNPLDADKYVLRFSPRKKGGIWSLANREKVETLIAAGKMTPSGITAIEEAKKNGQWDAAYTQRTPEKIPPDLEAALKNHKTARGKFLNLSSSHRNQYIYWINGAKTAATRQKRILETVKRAAEDKK